MKNIILKIPKIIGEENINTQIPLYFCVGEKNTEYIVNGSQDNQHNNENP